MKPFWLSLKTFNNELYLFLSIFISYSLCSSEDSNVGYFDFLQNRSDLISRSITRNWEKYRNGAVDPSNLTSGGKEMPLSSSFQMTVWIRQDIWWRDITSMGYALHTSAKLKLEDMDISSHLFLFVKLIRTKFKAY